MSDHKVFALKPLPTEIVALIAARNNGHSTFAPSSSGMWMNCSGSLVANALVDDVAGEAAAEGTVAHGVGELWLKTGDRPEHLLGTVEVVREGDQVFDITIDDVMLDYVEMYVNWCLYLPGSNLVEQRVDFSDLTPIPNQGGTADHINCNLHKLIITDLKYGIGVQVFAEWNTQALLYAYGAFRAWDWLYDFQEITIRICQPRLDHFDEWTIDRKTLLEFAVYAKERAHAAWCLDGPRSPGEKQCQFCRVKHDCAAFAAMIERLTEGVFDNLDAEVTLDEMADLKSRLDSEVGVQLAPMSAASLTTDQKVVIFGYKSLITRWLDDIGSDLYQQLKDGKSVKGWKLVDGRTQRDFGNEQAATDELEFLGLDIDEIKPRTMISPAQAEDRLVKQGYKRKYLPALLDKVIRRTRGNPTMVPETDKRPSIAAMSDGAFDNLDEDL